MSQKQDTVRVYRNLNKGGFSIQAKVEGKWKVVEHRETVALSGVTFKVYESGRQRTIAKHREVHAYAIGTLIDAAGLQVRDVVLYRPHTCGYFFTEDGARVDSAEIVLMVDGHCYLAKKG